VLAILLQHGSSSAFTAHPQRVSIATVLQFDTSHSNYQLDHAKLSCICDKPTVPSGSRLKLQLSWA